MVVLAGCICIDSQGRVLLIHRNTSTRIQWETPGGKVNQGETPAKAAMREALEELGAKAIIIKFIGARSFEEDGKKMVYHWFQARLEGEARIVEKEKFDELRYFTWEELGEMREGLSANAGNLVEAYFAGEIGLEKQE